MSSVDNSQMTKSEEYLAITNFGNYMESIVKPLSISTTKMNHLYNISNDLNLIINFGENIDYGPYPENFLERYKTYHNIINEIQDRTIFELFSTSLDEWVNNYSKWHNIPHKNQQINKIRSFKTTTFRRRIKEYINSPDT